MTKTPRWITATCHDAHVFDFSMPWERGARRAQMIARRKARGVLMERTA